jgi:hypothetical protein
MKISELIKKLETLKDLSGDIDVCYMADPYHDNDFYMPIDDVSIVKDPSPHIQGKRNNYTKKGTIIYLS